MVQSTHRIANPWTEMIHLNDAPSRNAVVVGPWWLEVVVALAASARTPPTACSPFLNPGVVGGRSRDFQRSRAHWYRPGICSQAVKQAD